MPSALPTTVGAVLRRSVAADPAHDAIVTCAETLSYRTLDERSATMARALVAIGAGKGTRIALLAPDGVLWLTTFLAAMRIGAIVAPLSTLCTAPELAYLLRHCDAQVFIGVRRFLRHEYAERLTAALPGLANSRGQLRLSTAPFLRSVWLDDATGAEWAGSLEALRARAAGPDAPDAGLLAAMESEVMPSDDAVIIYTSGSTSLPKAVLHTQRSVAHHPQVLGEHFRIKASDRMMPLLPLFWIGGLAMALEVLQAGGTLLYPESPALDTEIGRAHV